MNEQNIEAATSPKCRNHVEESNSHKIHNVHHSSPNPDWCRRAWLILGNVTLDAQWQWGIWSMSVQAEGTHPTVQWKLRAGGDCVALWLCFCISVFLRVSFSRKRQNLCLNTRVSFQITLQLEQIHNAQWSAWRKHLARVGVSCCDEPCFCSTAALCYHVVNGPCVNCRFGSGQSLQLHSRFQGSDEGCSRSER